MLSPMIRLLVGLGNPGPEYEQTRHNAGFWWIEAAAAKLGARLQAERAYFGLVARVNRATMPLWLLQPQTYMNLSGKSVAALARFYKIEPRQILVVHDELDLLPGQTKLKFGGSHAGHNGLRDIHAQLGSDDYWRLRIGIGHPGVKAEVVDYVLRKPAPDQREAIAKAIDASMAVLGLLVDGEMDKAMGRLNVRPPRPPAPGKPDPKAPPTADRQPPAPAPTTEPQP
jgi:PTH1 family peptidyl-tRNA hydrolase